MPSGKTHDAITIILAAPTFVAAWGVTGSPALALVVTAAMLFGGFMFGPDLDIQSRQYARWGIFRFLWFPYRVLFRHRSRWSHGIIFGTLIRVLYFTLVLALLVSAGVYLRAMLANGPAPSFGEIVQAWRAIEAGVRETVGEHAAWAVMAGLWWGAASHTLTDVTWSVL
ncbi:MAG TPA: metal-binding protein, partial [Pyrinomonadaceae bacterium]|nr:metal-binding protein [Pyrinomonadaceae bacterium]